jgi:hypothetical protein
VTLDASPPASETGKQDLTRAHPLARFGIDALVSGSARFRPDRIALWDHDENGAKPMRFAELDAAVRAFAARLGECGLNPAARILLCSAPSGLGLVAITAIVAAGFQPVLAPLQPTPHTFARAALSVGAEAFIAPAQFDELDFKDTLQAVAAAAPSIKLLGSLSPDPFEGAVDFSLSTLSAASKPPAPQIAENWRPGDRLALGAVEAGGRPAFLEQSALLSLGLDLVRKTRAGGAAPIVSLVSPGSFGGLIAGPLAALLSGAELHFVAPFKAEVFVRLLGNAGPVRLVAPAAILADLKVSGLLESGALLSCTAIGELEETALAQTPEDSCLMVEISSRNGALAISTPARIAAASIA